MVILKKKKKKFFDLGDFWVGQICFGKFGLVISAERRRFSSKDDKKQALVYVSYGTNIRFV